MCNAYSGKTPMTKAIEMYMAKEPFGSISKEIINNIFVYSYCIITSYDELKNPRVSISMG